MGPPVPVSQHYPLGTLGASPWPRHHQRREQPALPIQGRVASVVHHIIPLQGRQGEDRYSIDKGLAFLCVWRYPYTCHGIAIDWCKR